MVKLAKKDDEANKLLSEFRKIGETLANAELVCAKTDETKFDFNCFLFRLKFTEKIHNYEITLDGVLESEKENCMMPEKILLFLFVFFFEKGTFTYKDNVFKTKEEKSE